MRRISTIVGIILFMALGTGGPAWGEEKEPQRGEAKEKVLQMAPEEVQGEAQTPQAVYVLPRANIDEELGKIRQEPPER